MLHVASNLDIGFRLRISMIDRNLYSGLIRLHILHHAAEGPIFGQAMIDELGRHGYRLSAGTLYPILHGMERQGYLRSRLTLNGGRNRRVYRATPAGRKALAIGRPRGQGMFGEILRQPAGVSSDACWPEGAGDRQAARAGTVRRNVRAPVMGVVGAPMTRSAARILAILTMLCPTVASPP